MELDPCMLRRLSNGDYVCIEKMRDGDLARLRLGNAEGDEYVWRWESWLGPQDVSWLLQGLAFTHAMVDAHLGARAVQMQDRIRQLEAA